VRSNRMWRCRRRSRTAVAMRSPPGGKDHLHLALGSILLVGSHATTTPPPAASSMRRSREWAWWIWVRFGVTIAGKWHLGDKICMESSKYSFKGWFYRSLLVFLNLTTSCTVSMSVRST
jgi:hypothetical protein